MCAPLQLRIMGSEASPQIEELQRQMLHMEARMLKAEADIIWLRDMLEDARRFIKLNFPNYQPRVGNGEGKGRGKPAASKGVEFVEETQRGRARETNSDRRSEGFSQGVGNGSSNSPFGHE